MTVIVVMAVIVVMTMAAVAVMPFALGTAAVWVTNLGQILGPGLDVKFLKHLIGTVVLEELGDSALRVVEVAKDNGVRRANLRTSTINGVVWDWNGGITVRQFALPASGTSSGFYPSIFRFDSGRSDSLLAVIAFLHNTTHANRDIRIQKQSFQIVWSGLLSRLVIIGLHLKDGSLTHWLPIVIVKVIEPSYFVGAVV